MVSIGGAELIGTTDVVDVTFTLGWTLTVRLFPLISIPARLGATPVEARNPVASITRAVMVMVMKLLRIMVLIACLSWMSEHPIGSR
jgi:hypothetical protein